MRIKFTVPVNPIPWSRTRRAGKHGHVYNDPKTTNAKKWVAYKALQEMIGCNRELPHPGPIAVGLIFYRKNRQRCDLDRLVSLPLDAMNKIVYDDDLQVEEFLYVKRLIDPKNPRTEIEVEFR